MDRWKNNFGTVEDLMWGQYQLFLLKVIFFAISRFHVNYLILDKKIISWGKRDFKDCYTVS